jgi:hypothetical protein
MSKPALLLVVSTIVLAACSSAPVKQSITTTDTLTIAKTSASGSFGFSISRDDFDCYGFLPKANEARSVPLTDKPYVTVTFQFLDAGAGSVSSCTGVYTFKKNGSPRYVARINSTANSCAIAVFGEGKEGGSASTPLLLTRREFQQPTFDNNGPWCKPNAEFKGSSDYETAR